MKKIIILISIIALVGSLMIVFAEDNITIDLNGETLQFDTDPAIVESRTMVPIGVIFNALDMTVTWDGVNKIVMAEKVGLSIKLTINSDLAVINGMTTLIEVPAYIKDGRTMVPLRFVAESTGASVAWDGDTRTVSITTNEVVEDNNLTYAIVDTGVTTYYTDNKIVATISSSESFYGQDANYNINSPLYNDNEDGTVTDLVTDLMWQQTMNEKMTFDEALDYANDSQLGGYSDWRIPSIKELFSLILYTGASGGETAKEMFIDTDYFDQPIGDTSIGEREIDAQTWSSTKYVGKTMNGDDTIFGVNFVDGRIKGYGAQNPRTKEDNKMYFRLVRGNDSYGENNFRDNNDGTISDLATGLMWQLSDDGQTRDWEESLNYAEDLVLADHSDWRLPSAKELQSIVDYTRSMQTTSSPAIDDLFEMTSILDPDGNLNYGFYWTSTTHQDGINVSANAVYVSFGEAQGEMRNELMDVHGAGSVRSDPKSGSESDYPQYFGPQGDIRYVYNYVLAVRNID